MAEKDLILNGKRVYLRHWKKSDSKEINKKIQPKKIRKWLIALPQEKYTEKDALEFIKRQNKKSRKIEDKAFGIFLQDNDELIGGTGFHHIDMKNESAELGYWLSTEYWGNGYIPEAVNVLLNFEFRKLKLHRVFAFYLDGNIKSQRVLEKSGFRKEGVVREGTYFRGKYYNKPLYSILTKEFQKRY